MSQVSLNKKNVGRSHDAEENLRAIHADYYTSEDTFTQEKEKLFFKSWQYVCHVSDPLALRRRP